MSKGSKRRPAQIDYKQYADNFDRIFGCQSGTGSTKQSNGSSSEQDSSQGNHTANARTTKDSK